MLRLQKNWHLICCVLWAVISVATTAETNPVSIAESAELEPSQENSALLRNFFSVNLQKSQPPPPPPRKQIAAASLAAPRKLPIVSKHTQKARLRGLFKALRNPLARK